SIGTSTISTASLPRLRTPLVPVPGQAPGPAGYWWGSRPIVCRLAEQPGVFDRKALDFFDESEGAVIDEIIVLPDDPALRRHLEGAPARRFGHKQVAVG